MTGPDDDARHRLIDIDRSIVIGGTIDGDLLARLTPRILELRRTPEPITVLIDSPGGSIARTRHLKDLLTVAEGGREAPPIVTVVTGIAASAAAELLCWGDVAVAYPSASIHWHGTRHLGAEVTAESADRLAACLRVENDEIARAAARAMLPRLLQRYASVHEQLAAIRDEEAESLDDLPQVGSPDTIDVTAFAYALFSSVEHPVDDLALEALLWVANQYELRESFDRPLSDALRAALHAREDDRDETERRLQVLQALLVEHVSDREFELTPHSLREIAGAFDYAVTAASTSFDDDVLRIVLETPEAYFRGEEYDEAVRLAALGDGQAARERERFDDLVARAHERAEPMWAYTLALSQMLHGEEWTLDPRSAWWLGLIDAVVGRG